ncbi:hypothetical protein Syun_020869 [Stephania yunnanensis]|uniref:Uncharacterized protein n=1 Tax=Stephania yunnanensis TaxID=152371 RepID=A0AAP0IEZ8_9MAGN
MKKNDGLPFPLMITTFYRENQVNMAGLEIYVFQEKTIIDEVIERYGKIDRYEESEDKREKVEIASREIEQRRKYRDDTRRVLEEMLRSRNNLNVEQPFMDNDGLYMEELELAFMCTILHSKMRTLRIQELVFENQRALAMSIHMMEMTMSRRHRRQRGGKVPIPST